MADSIPAMSEPARRASDLSAKGARWANVEPCSNAAVWDGAPETTDQVDVE